MKHITVVVSGEDRLQVFKDLVDLLKKPNVSTSVIIEGDRGRAFLISPERAIEIKTEDPKKVYKSLPIFEDPKLEAIRESLITVKVPKENPAWISRLLARIKKNSF